MFDRDGNRITELSTLDDLRWFEGLNFRTLAGRGYGDGSFGISRDIARYLAINLAYRARVWDDGKIIYEGRVRELERALRGSGQQIAVPLAGFYSVLESRTIRWRWVDHAVVSRMIEPDGRLNNEDQNRLDSFYQDNLIRIRGGFDDTMRSGTEEFQLEYPDTPIPGNYIERMTYNIFMRSGEGVTIRLYNVDQATAEQSNATSSGANVDTTINKTLTGGNTERVRLDFLTTNNDLYDENDRMQVNNPAAYFDMPSFASPNYYADEYIQDILERWATDISADYDGLESPGLAIVPFTVETPTKASRVIERLANFGDGSQNTWGFFVWDSFGTSDDKPKAALVQRPSTDDWEYEVRLAELSNFDDAESIDSIYNYVRLEWEDERGRRSYLDPEDDSSLKDQTSIDAYGRRDWVESLGKCDQATALEIGQRRLAYRKDPKRRKSFGVQGWLRRKQGIEVPVSHVRAWERVKLLDYNDGEIVIIGSTQYQAARGQTPATVTITGEEPPERLEVLFAQQQAGLV